MDDKLFIGLDVGTDSVGWAATDGEFNLKRIKGKTAWGSRIFDEAQSAATRRGFRTAGRRLARRKARINFLNEVVGPYVLAKDPTFLIRLENSAFRTEDKSETVRNIQWPLFPTGDEEKEYYKKYPTIWHLRLALINGEKDAFSDERLVYLALHHIIKYRGNFLRDGDIDVNQLDDDIFKKLNEIFKSIYEEMNPESDDEYSIIDESNYTCFKKVVDNFANGNKTTNKKDLSACLNIDPQVKSFADFFVTLCVGGSFDSSKLGEEYEKKSITLEGDFDANVVEYSDVLGDKVDLVYLAKSIYDYADLKQILNGSDSLSKSFVAIYESHKEEKKALKEICHLIDKNENLSGDDSVYYLLFKDSASDKNYPAFVHDEPNKKRPTIHDFNAYIVKTIDAHTSSLNGKYATYWAQLKEFAQKDQLLQTIAIRSSSVIPMQLHLRELNAVIDNGIKLGLTWLGEIKEKLISIFKFRVPYYCGPLNPTSEYSNVVFDKNATKEKLTPWNYKEKIDFEQTRERFIGSLINKCTYLRSENVLPRQSLLFEEFDTLNKINGITINSQPLSQKEKSAILEYAYSHAKTTFSAIKNKILKKMGDAYKNALISGMSEVDSLSCSSHAFFKKAPFNYCLDNRNSADYQKAEEIVRIRTAFSDSPKDAVEYLKKQYVELTDEQLKAIKGFAPSGWASVSKALITLPSFDEDGEGTGFLIDIMEEEPRTFMSVLFDKKYNFLKTIEEQNRLAFGNLTKKQKIEDIVESTSPKMRRSVIQAYRIVEEVVKFGKAKPDSICIEFTRTEDKKKKGKYTDDRKKQLSVFLKTLLKDKDEHAQADHVIKELEDMGIDRLRGKHLFLYFLQNGRDVYTGEPIDINDVLNGQKYDTDHIIPQSFIKDDSIDNLVLVNRKANQDRKNEYPIPAYIRGNRDVQSLWSRLHKNKMMSDKKYKNLTRATPLTEDELNGFVNAQLTALNQSNKALASILKVAYPNTRVIYARSKYASLIRKELFIPKLRDLNETHHAVDAYLNVITGVKLNDRFGDLRIIKGLLKNIESGNNQDDKHSLNMENYVARLVTNKEDGTPTEFGEKVLNISQRHDFLMTYRRSYADDAFYDQTLYSPLSGKKGLIPTHSKENDPHCKTDLYGGYSGTTTAFNVAVAVHGRKAYRYLAPIKWHEIAFKKIDESLIRNIVRQNLAIDSSTRIDIDLSNLVFNSTKILYKGCVCLISSKNEGQVNIKPAAPIFLSLQHSRYMYNALQMREKYPNLLQEKQDEFVLERNRFKEETMAVSHETNCEVADYILGLAKNERYSSIPYIRKLSDFESGEAFLKEYAGNLSAEVLLLHDALALFGRKSTVLCKTITSNEFKPSRGSVLENETSIVCESITGLYSSRPIKL